MTPKNQDQPKLETEEEVDERFRRSAEKWEEFIKTPEGKKVKAEMEKALKPILDLMHPQPEDMERREK